MNIRNWNKPTFILLTSVGISLEWSRRSQNIKASSIAIAICEPTQHHAIMHHHFPVKTPSFEAILPIHSAKTANDETLLEWSENRQQNNEPPINNLTEMMAFLGLLGVQEISLCDIARVKNSTTGFLLKLPKLRQKNVAHVLFTPQDVLSMVQELKIPKVVLRSYKPSAPNPIDSVKPIFEVTVKRSIDLEVLATFYESIALATDEDLHALCRRFLGELDSERHSMVFNKLKDSKSLCKMYFNLRDYSTRFRKKPEDDDDDDE